MKSPKVRSREKHQRVTQPAMTAPAPNMSNAARDLLPSHGVALSNAAQSAASVIKAVTQPIARKTSRPRKPSIRSNTLATTTPP